MGEDTASKCTFFIRRNSFIFACKKKNVQELLKLNADPNYKDILDRTALHHAINNAAVTADASFELLLNRAQPEYKPPFELIDYMVVVERLRRASASDVGAKLLSEATVKVRVGGKIMHTAAEGNGPVNALDQALRKALIEFYPSLNCVELVDYKVRILEESSGTASHVRVLIESSDGHGVWRTVGSSTDIIDASWLALADSMEYWLLKSKCLPLTP